MRKKRRAVARGCASDPISLIAAEIHRGCRPAGINGGWLGIPIQNMCQRSTPLKAAHFQRLGIFAAH
jgi:hypothetical protein